jgi:transcriptional regulator with XRE-family HTH domain
MREILSSEIIRQEDTPIWRIVNAYPTQGLSVMALNRSSAPMTPDEAAFFVQLGTRIAERRKTLGLTQAQLGELVDVTQQQIASFEIGRRRMPISTLPALARALGISIEALIGEQTKSTKRGPAPKLQQQLERIQSLPKAQQKAIAQVIDSVLAAHQ